MTADLYVPELESWVAHLSDTEFEALVRRLHSPNAASRPWLETALVHPSYLRDLDSQLSRGDPAVILLHALEQAGEAALSLCLVSVALLDLDLATPAEANVAVRLARQAEPLRRIAEELDLADIAAYGRVAEGQLSDPHAKTKWLKRLGSAFLGACALGEFQNADALVKEVVEVSELTPRTIDSHKTVLQELASKRGLPQPVYSLIESSGPDHERVFRVGVAVGSLRAQGEGTSKKRAEESAARELLTRRMPGAGNPVGVRARSERPGPRFQFTRLPTRERRQFEQLASRLGATRSAPAISRAFIHPSYAFEKGLRPDETNAALALLGSAVISVWATRLQLASLAGYADVGTPEVLTTSPWDVGVCAKAGRAMGLDRCLLVGRGEKNPNQRIVGEAFQALVGALYAELGDPAAIAERMPEAMEILWSSFEVGWLDTKTELERRLGPSGIRIEYHHDERGPDHNKAFISDAVLSSPDLGESVRIIGPGWAASKTAAEKATAAAVQRR